MWLLTALAPADEPPAGGGHLPKTRSESPGADGRRVVLLKNDRCLTGLVRQLGDQVVIEFDDNARVSKAANDIQFIADDLEGIYRHKLTLYAHMGPGENIRMARWCLALGLNEHAVRHFLAVHRVFGERPEVKQLGVELREQLLADEGFRDYLGLAPLKKSSSGEPHSVQTVASGGQENPLPILPAVVAAFTDQVQPILLNRCSQSGCHGFSASNKLKIIQPLGSARGRISEQNCRSALQFVEVDDSNMSILLRYALTAHGIQKAPGIASQEPKLIESLQSWTTFARNPVVAAVETSASRPSGSASPAVYNARVADAAARSGLLPVEPGAAQLRSVPRQPKFGVQPDSGLPGKSELDELDDQVRRALGEPPRSAVTPPPATNSVPAANLPAGSFPAPRTPAGSLPAGSSPETPAARPVDPFDPAEFNRQAADKSKP